MKLLLAPLYAIGEVVATVWAATLIVRLDTTRTRLAALERDLDRARLARDSTPAAFRAGAHADVCRLEGERDAAQKRKALLEARLAELGLRPPGR